MSKPIFTSPIFQVPEADPSSERVDSQTDKKLVVFAKETTDHQELLTKILSALKIDDVDIAVNHTTPDISNLFAHTADACVVFTRDIRAIFPNGDFRHYHVYRVNGRQLLFSEPLSVLAGNRKSKKLLWSGLQQLQF